MKKSADDLLPRSTMIDYRDQCYKNVAAMLLRAPNW
jgi:hypothetical protein